MITNTGGLPHLTDDELMALVDRGAPAIGAAGEAHLGECLSCSERLDELEQASAWLHDNVAALDVPVDQLARARALRTLRGARVGRGRLRGSGARAAAAASLLVAAALSVQPVRAWVAEAAGGLVAALAPPAAETPSAGSSAAGALVAFIPAERAFRIELEHAQPAGRLTIEWAEGSEATAQVLDGGEETLAVLPAGLLIGNSATSVASYSVVVPAGRVGVVEVVAAGRLLLDAPVSAAPEPVVLELAASSSR